MHELISQEGESNCVTGGIWPEFYSHQGWILWCK